MAKGWPDRGINERFNDVLISVSGFTARAAKRGSGRGGDHCPP